MSNKINPSIKKRQQTHQQEVKSENNVTRDEASSGKDNRKIKKWGSRVRKFLGAEFIGRVEFRKHIPYIVMLVCMILFFIYMNLLIQSNRKRLENLDMERIKLNDKYIQIIDEKERMYVDSLRQRDLLEVFKNKGFVDDSSIVYTIIVKGKEESK